MDKFIVVVTPIYEDTESASCLFSELSSVSEEKFFIVAVDDGSVHSPVNIEMIKNTGLDGVVIKLKRNVGHQKAIAVGLSYVEEQLSNYKRVVVMDSDGEDAPNSICDLLQQASKNNVDVVVAQRKSRVETLWFRSFYIVYKWIFRVLVGRWIDFGNFMVMKPSAVSRVVSMHELWLHLASCVLVSRLRVVTYPLDRGERYAGIGKTNFIGQVLHGFRAIMVFAEDVLVRVGVACALVAILAVLGGVTAVFLKLLGFATPGWFSIAVGILLLVFLQTGALTLMTLMLTGVVKSGAVDVFDYDRLIDRVEN